jgi:hypothetical protein
LGLLLPGVELDEHLSLVNRPARIECDAVDDAWEVRAHGHALNGGHRPNGAQRYRPPLLRRDNGCDGLGRWLKGSGLRSSFLELPKFHEAKGSDEQSRYSQHKDHPFHHEFLLKRQHHLQENRIERHQILRTTKATPIPIKSC